MGRPRNTRHLAKHLINKKVGQVIKTVDITFPFMLLQYCIQTRDSRDECHEAKATVLTKKSKQQICLRVWHTEDMVNVKLEGLNDLPVICKDDICRCCIECIELPPDGSQSKQTSDSAIATNEEQPSSGTEKHHHSSTHSDDYNIQHVFLQSDEKGCVGSKSQDKPVCHSPVRTVDGNLNESSKACCDTQDEVLRCEPVINNNKQIHGSRSVKVKKTCLHCLLCKASFSKVFGLKRHVLRKHGMSWTEYGNYQQDNSSGLLLKTLSNNKEEQNTEVNKGKLTVDGQVEENNASTDNNPSQDEHKDCAKPQNMLQPSKNPTDENGTSVSKCTALTSTPTVCLDCPKCHMSYMDRKTILNHVRLCHKDCSDYGDLLVKVENMFYQMYKCNAETRVVIACAFCQAERVGRSIFKHLEICHMAEPNYKGILQQTKAQYFGLLRGLRNEKKRAYEYKLRTKGHMYSCKFCSKQFKYRPARSNHENFRCRENPKRRRLFECYICGFSTPKEDTFEAHKNKHSQDAANVNACSRCGKTYKTRAGLTTHQRKVHKIFSKHPIIYLECDQCKKKFYDKDHLNKHLVTHSNERPFQCELCGQQYKTVYAVKKHQKMVHYNKYTYHCDKCGHGVEKKQYLKKHICGRTRRVQDQDALPLRRQSALKKKHRSAVASASLLDRDCVSNPSVKYFASDVINNHMAAVSEENAAVQELVNGSITESGFSDQNSTTYIPGSYCLGLQGADLQQDNVTHAVVLTEPQLAEHSLHLDLKANSGNSTLINAGNEHNLAKKQSQAGRQADGQLPTADLVNSGLQSLSQNLDTFNQQQMVNQSSEQPTQVIHYPAGTMKAEEERSKNDTDVIQLEYSQLLSLHSANSMLNLQTAPTADVSQPHIALPQITLASYAVNSMTVPSMARPLALISMASDMMSLPASITNTGVALEPVVITGSEQLPSLTESISNGQNQAVMLDLQQFLPAVSYNSSK